MLYSDEDADADISRQSIKCELLYTWISDLLLVTPLI